MNDRSRPAGRQDAVAAFRETHSLGIAEGGLAHVEAAPRIDVAEPPLTGRVVHQRDQMDREALREYLGLLDDVGRGISQRKCVS
jgi:hypothetical protein